jgi:acetyltransferase-like isoleucine patch superfamily enzyme
MHRKNSYEFVKSFVKRILYRPKFSTNDIKIGCETRFGRNVRFNCKRVRIGNGVIFHDNIRVDAEEFDVGDGVIFQDDIRIETTVFRIGDYGTIYFGCFFPGPGKLEIGHNFWLGNNSIIDSQGGTVIGNNVGIGADSQLWTHMKYGDIVAGCRFDSVAPLTIGNGFSGKHWRSVAGDAWIACC